MSADCDNFIHLEDLDQNLYHNSCFATMFNPDLCRKHCLKFYLKCYALRWECTLINQCSLNQQPGVMDHYRIPFTNDTAVLVFSVCGNSLDKLALALATLGPRSSY